MPVIPNVLERLLFTGTNLAPGPMLDVFGAFAFRIAAAAVRLGVFDALDAGPLTAAALSERIGTSDRGTRFLLDALESLGYVRQRRGQYSNTRLSERWMVRSRSDSVESAFEFYDIVLSEHYRDLEDTIKRGAPSVDFYDVIAYHPETSAAFQRWMTAGAVLGANEVFARARLPRTIRQVLDVGGGHGMWSIALCNRYPQVCSTIFDGEHALAIARENLQRSRVADRVKLQNGDFLEDDLGTGYDAALVFNIVHGLDAARNQRLLSRVAQALNRNGRIVIQEQLVTNVTGHLNAIVARVLGLNYFHLLNGQIYRFEQVSGWLRASGFDHIRRVNLLRAPGVNLVIATKVG